MYSQPTYSISYAIPYCILGAILIAIYIWYTNNNTRSYGNIIATLIILFFIGLRGHVQSDFIAYYKFFESVPTIWNPKFTSSIHIGFEPGFIIYTAIVKSIWPNYFFWVFVNTAIDIWILSWCFKRYSTSSILSWLFFILFNGLAIEFNLYRNSKAIVIFILSIPYIQQRRFLPFFMLWLLELTFHTSSLIYLPTYFILNREYNRKIIFILFILSNIIFFFKLSPTSFLIDRISSISSIFPTVSKAIGYFENNSISAGITLGYIERTFLFITALYLYPHLLNEKKSNLIFINAFFLYYFLFYLFSDVVVFVQRFPLLFTFSYWILGPNLINLAKGVSKRLWMLGFFIFYFIKVTSITNQLPYRYDNLTWGIEGYQQRKAKYFHFEGQRQKRLRKQ